MKKFITLILIFLPFIIFAQPVPPKRELRGVWIASVTNIDWPSRSNLTTQQQRNDFIAIINKHKSIGINAIFIQIRPSCDAFYGLGRTEPWSQYLMGTQGSAPLPYYDPLQFIVDECHKRGIEVHCWFNPYRSVVSSGSSVHSSHVSVTHPEWNLRFGTPYKLLDPGIPDARNYVTNVILSVVKNYDIEGVHFDDYFYPYEGITDQDSASQRLYKPTSMAVGDWRRENVNKLIRSIYDSIQIYKPWVKFGISPFGIWKSGTPTGITGLNAYSDIYCDAITWLNEKKVDYIQPQLYWAINKSGQEYWKLMPWWSTVTNGRHLYTGNAAHNLSSSLAWPASELCDQIRMNRMNVKTHGEVFFSSKVLTGNTKGFADSLRTDLYKYPALPPTMPWKDSIPPLKPANPSVSGDTTKIVINWTKPNPAPDGETPKYYIIYRGVNTVPSISNPQYIKYVSTTDTNIYQDTLKVNKYDTYYYYITSVDRLHNESEPSDLIAFSLTDVENIFINKYTYNLEQNYPNPFNPSTTINFQLAKGDDVQLKLYDVLGNEIATLINEYKSTGKHSFILDISKYNIPSGVYFYRIQTKEFNSIKKMMYLK